MENDPQMTRPNIKYHKFHIFFNYKMSSYEIELRSRMWCRFVDCCANEKSHVDPSKFSGDAFCLRSPCVADGRRFFIYSMIDLSFGDLTMSIVWKSVVKALSELWRVLDGDIWTFFFSITTSRCTRKYGYTCALCQHAMAKSANTTIYILSCFAPFAFAQFFN